MDKKTYLYIVEAGQFSFEVEIEELLGKVGDTICISTDGIAPDGFDVKITCMCIVQCQVLIKTSSSKSNLGNKRYIIDYQPV